jgi:hypothetical protein
MNQESGTSYWHGRTAEKASRKKYEYKEVASQANTMRIIHCHHIMSIYSVKAGCSRLLYAVDKAR